MKHQLWRAVDGGPVPGQELDHTVIGGAELGQQGHPVSNDGQEPSREEGGSELGQEDGGSELGRNEGGWELGP